MSDLPIDLLIIGGGATGAGVARDAAMRGLRTVLLDKGDFGSGTSSRSSRMVHGGLRDLEAGNLKFVFQASRERRILTRIAPHLVWPRTFLFPIHEGSRLSLWKLGAGLFAYDALALFRNTGFPRLLGRKRALRLEPGIRPSGLKGAGLYHDALCDDARLTLANVRSAHAHGALVANYVRVDDLERADGRVTGVRATDVITNDRYSIRARIVVNATGPWTDDLLAHHQEAPLLRNIRGAHIAVPRHRIGNNDAVTMLSAVDGRLMFVIPWGDLTYVGTTEMEDGTDPDDVRVSAAEVVYLLRSANAMFPAARLAASDIVSTWAGDRPVARDGSRGFRGSASRAHCIVESEPGVISVIGGKLTTHRAMAAEVVDRVGKALNAIDGRNIPGRPGTAAEPLPGGEVADLAVMIDEISNEGFDRAVAEYLVYNCGTEATAVIRIAQGRPELTLPVVPGHPAIRAMLVHAMRREMAMTLEDLLTRRTRVFFEVLGHGVPEIPAVVDLAADELGWDPGRKAHELARYLQLIQHCMAFRDEMG